MTQITRTAASLLASISCKTSRPIGLSANADGRRERATLLHANLTSRNETTLLSGTACRP